MAYNGLYAKYSPVIASYIYNMVPGIEAFHKEEIHTLTMSKAFLKLRQYRPTFPISVWLKSIARNNTIDFLRKLKINSAIITDQEIVDHITPQSLLEIAEMKNCLQGFICSQKNEFYKKVLELRYDFGMSCKTISNKMEMPLGSVTTILHRKRNEIKNALLYTL